MVPDSGCEKRKYRSMSSTDYLLSSWHRRKRWDSGLLRTVCPCDYCFRTSLEEERHLALLSLLVFRLSLRTAPGWHGMEQEALTTCRGRPQHSDQICHSILAQQVSYHRRVIHVVVIIIVHRDGLESRALEWIAKTQGPRCARHAWVDESMSLREYRLEVVSNQGGGGRAAASAA